MLGVPYNMQRCLWWCVLFGYFICPDMQILKFSVVVKWISKLGACKWGLITSSQADDINSAY